MQTYTFNGSKYQVIVEDGDIRLEGLHNDIHYFGAWDELYKALEQEFWTSEFCQIRSMSEFIDYEMECRILCYLDNHKADGKILAHCNN